MALRISNRFHDDMDRGRATPAQNRGYVLEAAIAALLDDDFPVVSPRDSPTAGLRCSANTVYVVGRGGEHQADVLAEGVDADPFGVRTRVFLEAKFHSVKVGLPVLRNAAAILADINQAHSRATCAGRRGETHTTFHYRYVTLSTSGFTKPAQGFAHSHQIALVDLSSEAFAELRRIVSETTLMFYLADPYGSWSASKIHSSFRRARGLVGSASPVVHEPFVGIAAAAVERLNVLQQPERYPVLASVRPNDAADVSPGDRRSPREDPLSERLGGLLRQRARGRTDALDFDPPPTPRTTRRQSKKTTPSSFVAELRRRTAGGSGPFGGPRAEALLHLTAGRGGAIPLDEARQVLGADNDDIKWLEALRRLTSIQPCPMRQGTGPDLSHALVLEDDLTDYLTG